MSLTPGTRLGPYEIVAPLGVGGMGEVYRSLDTKLNREVAIKVLPEAFAADPDRLARFQREAQLLASLNHPNIAHLYGLEGQVGRVGQEGREGQVGTFLVMELVEGPTLADRIAGGPIPLDEALPIARQITEALEAAHERGIIHRDLKPANIKIAPDGTVKVLDFGLAKMIEPETAASSLTMSPTLSLHATYAGVILGTAAYMSPEQARGRTVDRRTDVWAFGCVLFEMLSGARPFDGEDLAETIGAVIHKEPAWARLPATLPTIVRTVLKRCLEKDPKERIRDIGDVQLALKGAFESPTVSGPTQLRPARRQRWWIAAIVVMALIALALGGSIFLRPSVVAEPVRFVVLPPEGELFNNGPGLLSISPDGHRLAFVTLNGTLWVRPLGSLIAQQLPGIDDAWQPFWSPDGRYVAFNPINGGKLKKIDVSGGPPLTLTDSTRDEGVWSSQGVILYEKASDGRLYRIPEGGGASIPVTELDKARQETGHAWPIFLPDGRRFIFLARTSDVSKSALYLASLDSPVRTHLLDVLSSVAYASGYLLYQRDGTLMAQPFDEKKGRVTGDASPVVEGLTYNSTNGRAAFAVSANGVLVYRQGAIFGRSRLTWIDASGKSLATLGSQEVFGLPRLSPDRRRVVVEQGNNGARDLWMIDVDRGIPSRFTFDPADDDAPVWSPDGARVIFASARKGPFDLYQRASGGAAADEVVFESADNKRPTGFSPDGKLLLFNRSMIATKVDIWALPMTGDRKPFPVIATPFNEGYATFSPDGRWIVYDSDDSGANQVYVQPFPATGGKVQLSTTSGNSAAWSADGKTVFYRTSDFHMMAVSVTGSGGEFHAAAPRELFVSRQTGNVRSFGIDPSGDRFLIPSSGEEQAAAPITVVLNWTAGLKK